MNTLEEIRDRSQVHSEINERYHRFKIRDCITRTQNEWKGEELSENSMGKGLHKFFMTIVNELNNT